LHHTLISLSQIYVTVLAFLAIYVK